jgi:hypothetical protein
VNPGHKRGESPRSCPGIFGGILIWGIKSDDIQLGERLEMFCDRSGYPRKFQGGAALGTLSDSLRFPGFTAISESGCRNMKVGAGI